MRTAKHAETTSFCGLMGQEQRIAIGGLDIHNKKGIVESYNQTKLGQPSLVNML